jgi:hypothetical protein
MKKIECFKIRLLKGSDKNVWKINEMERILDIPCDRFSLSLNPKTILADPFLFVFNNILYLFFESKKNYSYGEIQMICTTDLSNWSAPITVLKETGHLSYPFVFEYDNEVYMIPESSYLNEVRLYKADNDNLSSFSYYKTLIDDYHDGIEVGFSDSSIYNKDGLFYLMTSKRNIDGENVYYLYLSEDLLGSYYSHPQSPILISKKYGRNAGSLIEIDGKLYRVAQDCEKRYGDNVHLFEVDELSNLSYKEHLVRHNLIPLNNSFYKEGGHQYNVAIYNDVYLVATDAKEYHTFGLCRIIHKFGMIINRLFFQKVLSIFA